METYRGNYARKSRDTCTTSRGDSTFKCEKSNPMWIRGGFSCATTIVHEEIKTRNVNVHFECTRFRWILAESIGNRYKFMKIWETLFRNGSRHDARESNYTNWNLGKSRSLRMCNETGRNKHIQADFIRNNLFMYLIVSTIFAQPTENASPC